MHASNLAAAFTPLRVSDFRIERWAEYIPRTRTIKVIIERMRRFELHLPPRAAMLPITPTYSLEPYRTTFVGRGPAPLYRALSDFCAPYCQLRADQSYAPLL
jgi:hypothetical protein